MAPPILNLAPAGCAPGAGLCAACAARPFSICAAAAEADLAQLEALAEPVSLARGAALFRQGDPAGHVYTLTQGSVRLSALMADGRRQVLGFAFAGDFLGLDRARVHGWTAEALEPVGLCRFERGRYDALVQTRRELEGALLARAGDALGAAQAHILLLGRKTARERVASFLLRLPGCDPARTAPPGLVRLTMTRSDMADYLGLTLETVSRTLGRLKRQGIIRQLSLGALSVADPAALRAAAGED